MKPLLIAFVLATAAAHARNAPQRSLDGIDPWLATFSIIAFDPAFESLRATAEFQRLVKP